MHLRHLRLPGLTPYTKASATQDKLVQAFLVAKASASATSLTTKLSPPLPTIITAEFNPVYTCGRREIGTVSSSSQAFLRDNGRAEFHEALRGGQTTFHGPGQLTAYPILDLKSHGLNPRNYVCLLEKTVIATLARYGVKAFTTEHPGVWTTDDDKICALGVHLRRNITSHGIGLNVATDLTWFSRIVACGLEGKRTTSLENEGVKLGDDAVEQVGNVFVEEFAKALQGVDSVVEITEDELD
ncbi:hypothetical protein AAFC00_000276 [Neodothiora populina]|uniref:Octanoyltransferase n=1 Tax=Neodothiora populina TaxID=2781224 RepID=A0ABR3PDK5_9PEZI